MQNQSDRTDKLLPTYLRYAFSTSASLLCYTLFSIVDGVFIARGVGEEAMGAVNLALPYTNLLFFISALFAVGIGTIIAILMGQNRTEDADRLFTQNLVSLVIVGGVLTFGIMMLMDPFVRLLGGDAATFAYTKSYLTGLAPFSTCFIVSYNLEMLIKTDGHPQMALIAVVASCIINCLLDYLAVFVLGMGVFGAALATGISQLSACLIYLQHFLFGKPSFRFTRFRFDMSLYPRLFSLGLADGIVELCVGLIMFVYNRTVLVCLGETGLICFTVVAYVNTMMINTLYGTSAGAQPLVSFRHGREDGEACRRLLIYACILAVFIGALFAGIISICGLSIVKVFLGGGDPQLNRAALQALRRYCLVYPLLGLDLVIVGYFTAREHAKSALVLSACRGFLIPSSCLLLIAALWGGNVIWFSGVIAEVICVTAALLRLHQLFPRQKA